MQVFPTSESPITIILNILCWAGLSITTTRLATNLENRVSQPVLSLLYSGIIDLQCTVSGIVASLDIYLIRITLQKNYF